jgi:hypothetical protein
MGRHMKWLIVIVASISGLYAAYAITYPSYSYRFRITLEVETVDGLKSGSSVLEVTTIQRPSWVTLGANDHQTTVRGEAVFVDLGNGRNLIALLSLGPEAADGRATLFAPRSFFKIVEGAPHDIKWTKDLSTMTGRREYAGDRRPTLVTFANLNDPATVREVPFDNPKSVLGPDVHLVRAWIDLTKDLVTERLASKLPWINQFESAQTAWRIIRRGQYGSGASPLQIFKLKG